MRSWMPLVVTVVVAVLTVIANAVINTTIRFAPNAATARNELKRLGSKVLRRLLDVANLVAIIYNVTLPEPMNGVRVFGIALGVGTVFFVILSAFIVRMFEMLSDQQRRVLEILDKHANGITVVAERVVQIMKATESHRTDES